MRALNNIIILKEINENIVLESGFVMPDKDAGEMKYHKGEVVTVGPDVKAAKEGDIIFYDNHRAYDTVIEGNKVTVIREIDGIVVLD